MNHSRTSPHFELLPAESLSESLRRIVREQIDQANKLLTSSGPGWNGAMHDSRLCFKKIRAVLRLVRKELGREIFRCEDDCYRDASRTLAAPPDIIFSRCISDRLGAQVARESCGSSIENSKRRLLKEATPEHSTDHSMLKVVLASLASARERVGNWPLDSEGFAIVAGGLKRCYREGSNCCYRALESPSPRNLRDWRKQVMYLRYQVSIFRPVWPKVVGGLANQLKGLGEYLNEYCDLIILREAMSDPAMSLRLAEIADSRPRMERKCRDLEKKAVAVAQRVYAESPKAFVQRMNEYWLAWRLEKATNVAAAARR